MNDDPYQWKPWVPPFHLPLDQRIQEVIPCMNNASKPPEETPTPSTASLPSYQEWYNFFVMKLTQLREVPNGYEGPMATVATELVMEFLAQRGSRP